MEDSFVSPENPGRRTDSFRIDDRVVSVDIFASPKGPGPAIILLHGADGLNLRPDAYDRIAAFLAKRGYCVFVVHYFDGTGVEIATRSIMLEKFTVWAESAGASIRFAMSQRELVSDGVGLVGFSLGEGAFTYRCSYAAEIGAVVEYFGSMPARDRSHPALNAADAYNSRRTGPYCSSRRGVPAGEAAAADRRSLRDPRLS